MSSKILMTSAALLLGACNTVQPQSGSPDPAFGEAFKYDMAVQIIDPDPVYDDSGAQPGDNGDKGARAVERYRTDKVKDVKALSTSTAGGQGASSSGPR